MPLPPQPAPPPCVDDGSARITFVGHATLLIQVAGLNILTDPVWSERASPFSFAGPKRVTPPGVAWESLPKIDLAIIPIGAYEPASFKKDSHMGLAEAVKLMADVKARQAMAHHFETFQLGFEAYDVPRNAPHRRDGRGAVASGAAAAGTRRCAATRRSRVGAAGAHRPAGSCSEVGMACRRARSAESASSARFTSMR